MKIKYIRGRLDTTAGKSFGRLTKHCYFCGKVTPRHCSIDSETHNGVGNLIRVCRKCQKEYSR